MHSKFIKIFKFSISIQSKQLNRWPTIVWYTKTRTTPYQTYFFIYIKFFLTLTKLISVFPLIIPLTTIIKVNFTVGACEVSGRVNSRCVNVFAEEQWHWHLIPHIGLSAVSMVSWVHCGCVVIIDEQSLSLFGLFFYVFLCCVGNDWISISVRRNCMPEALEKKVFFSECDSEMLK